MYFGHNNTAATATIREEFYDIRNASSVLYRTEGFSVLYHQFGRQIKATVLETLKRLEVTDAKVTVVDKGALDCTLKARVECAVYRSNDVTENLPWGGVIK